MDRLASLIIGLSVIIYSLLIGQGSLPLYAEDKIVAIVNNDVITQKDLNDFLNFMRMQFSAQYKGKELENKIQSIKMDLLNKLIEDRIILREAKLNNAKIDDARVKAKIDEIKKRYTSDMEFQHTLAQQGLTQADIESKIREQLLMYAIIDYKIRTKIVIKPSEVTEFYQQHIADFVSSEERGLEVIAVDKKDLAEEIYKVLSSGAEIKDVAAKYSLSVDKITARGEEQLNKDIEEVVFKLKMGEISQPVSVQGIFYIFKLDSITPPRQGSLREAQDKISEFLFEKKMQEDLANWLDEIKKQSYVKILQN